MKTLPIILNLFLFIDSFGQTDSILLKPKLPYWDTLITNTIRDSRILISYNEEFELYSDSIIEGDKIVFEYNKIHKELHFTSSDYYERVIFEIDSEIKEFDYSDEDLKTIKCVMDIGCHYNWWEYQDYSVSNGRISGKETPNGSWKIKVDINNGKRDSQYFYKVEFEEDFLELIIKGK